MKPRCYAAAGLFVLSLSTLGGCSNRENAEKDVTKTSAPALANPQAAAPPADTKDSLQDPASVSAVAPKSVTLADDAEKKSLAEGLEVEKAAADAAKSSQPANTFAATPYQPQAQFKSSASGSFGSRMARGYAGSSQANKSMYSIAPSVPPLATYNPNMYVSDTYIGGNGEKDRIEKLINAGVLVDGKRVKLEAFSHNYAQSFPIPTTMALDVTADTVHGKLLQQGGRTFLQIGLQAMKGEMPRRAPLNIALVIDRSGSMGDEHKLDYAKAAATKLLDSLAPTDTFTLVVFDDQAQVLVPAQHVTNRAHIRNQIAALQPGGSTNIYDGLKLAYSQVGKFVNTDSVNRVILLSDGEVTAGVQDAQQFHHLAAANVDADIQTSAVGVGVEFNEDLMLSLAKDGKGNYHFLKDGKGTQQVFAKELDELTHVVAKAVKLRVQLAPGVGLVRVLGAQTLSKQQTAQVKADEKKIDRKVAEELGITENRQDDKDEPGVKMLIPDFYRGDSHVVMMEITVPRQLNANPATCKIANVSLKYKDLVGSTNREIKKPIAVAYTADRNEMLASINRGVKKNLLGFETGEALTQAATLLNQGRVDEAIQRVDARMTVLGVAAQAWHDKDLDQDGKLLDRYKSVLGHLGRDRQLAQGECGQYLTRSLTYNGYQMTR